MSELHKTLSLGGAGLVLLAVVLVSAPRRAAPDAFFDIGQPFFPEFTDPEQATSLQVTEYNEDTAASIIFEVTNRNGLWTIPSHHSYPADGDERLSKTAAGLIALVKGDFRGDNVTDHEMLGVIDPIDDTVGTLKGRGKRVTVKDGTGRVLADLIIGLPVDGSPAFSFVRVPGQSRVYAANLGFEISTKFEDWIERDLLQVERDDITRVVRNDYQIVEERGGFAEIQGGTFTLEKKGEDEWTTPRMPASREIDMVRMNRLIGVLDELMLVGVRPKPPGVTQDLRAAIEQRQITQSDVLSLQGRGFYLNITGQIYSNDGELLVWSRDGVRYTLRFGEVVYGTGEAVTIGTDASGDATAGPAENRYMMISAEFDPSVIGLEPQRPATREFEKTPENQWTDADRRNNALADAHDSWERRISEGKKRAALLATRFAKWYYLVSADSFERLRISRDTMLKAKEAKT